MGEPGPFRPATVASPRMTTGSAGTADQADSQWHDPPLPRPGHPGRALLTSSADPARAEVVDWFRHTRGSASFHRGRARPGRLGHLACPGLDYPEHLTN
jgi:hypothetical protein